MTYSPAAGRVQAAMPMHPTIDIYGVNGGSISGGAWPSANLGIFVPHTFLAPITLKRAWYIVSQTAGNLDIGLYTRAGALVVSTGSTAMGATNTLHFVDITDTTVPAGEYFFAMACSSTSAQPMRSASANLSRSQGLCQMASALALPSTATFAVIGQDYIPYFGFSTLSAEL